MSTGFVKLNDRLDTVDTSLEVLADSQVQLQLRLTRLSTHVQENPPTTSVPVPPTSAPLPPVVGLTTSALLPPAAGPTTSAPLPLTAGRLMASASPSHMASGSTPPPAESVRADDEMSHHEGEGSYNEMMRAAWINEGNKIESAQASQFITKTIQAHFPGPIHRFSDFSMDVQDLLFSMFLRNHRFTEHSDELRARSAWTTTARANFKHFLYNVRKNAERACASTDKNQWKEHGPVWMRKEYWTELCNIWGAEKWNENSSKAKQNRAAHPEANVHTSGSVSFATHKARLEVQFKQPPQFQELFDETHKKKGTNDYISEKAREVAESYSRGMDERYGDDSQCPELDPDIWVAASGAPKKGHVYGFGHSLGTTRVISSCSSSVSHATSPFTTPAALGGSSSAALTITPDKFRAIVNETVS
ncbi:hypothetical protein Taro_015922 [Colocasia esculenta]|uniref:Uncharacterized protein n=1 Tax=Colocasia esculenta TaxID=4460 RepID=A0A843UIV7_COLES|nr:hypothetical protein [Colocasia esculenta]